MHGMILCKPTQLKILLSLFFFFFYCFSSTVVSIFLPPLPPSQPSPPSTFDLTSLPWSHLPLALPMCPVYMFLDDPSPLPPLSPPTSHLVTVSLFFISMSLVIFCLLVCFIRFHLYDIWSYGIWTIFTDNGKWIWIHRKRWKGTHHKITSVIYGREGLIGRKYLAFPA